jgi:hypothetical protein
MKTPKKLLTVEMSETLFKSLSELNSESFKEVYSILSKVIQCRITEEQDAINRLNEDIEDLHCQIQMLKNANDEKH